MERGPNRLIQLRLGEHELVVSEMHDSIQRFEDSTLDYLKYWDAESSMQVAYWLGSTVLRELADSGIPTVDRKRFTDAEEDLYIGHQNNVLEVELQEFYNE